MWKSILRLLYPPKCIFCDAVLEHERFAVCKSCLKDAPKNKRPCKICGTPLDSVYGEQICTSCRGKRRGFTRAYVPFIYKDSVRKAVLGLKFGAKRARAITFAALIHLKMQEENATLPDVITYAPMHFIRLGMRGFNQAELIAKALGDIMHIPVKPLLRKNKHTKPQSKKSGAERKKHLQGVYSLRKNTEVKGKKILLVDDVITTGTTLSVCAGILKKAGAEKVHIAAFAATEFLH